MANRGIRELLRLAVVDYRFYLGTIADYSGNGNDGVWSGTDPVFRREVGGATGLDFTAAGQSISTPAIAIPQEFTVASTFMARTIGENNEGRIFEQSTSTIRAHLAAGPVMTFDCGAAISPAITIDQPRHVVFTRDNADDGQSFIDSVPGATGAVGATVGTDVIVIGNRAALDRTFDGLIFAFLLLATHIDPDEAARLYEHSRIQLWPGAPKRSGIMSPVE